MNALSFLAVFRCVQWHLIHLLAQQWGMPRLAMRQDMPDKYIYEPWMAPPAVQATAKCIVGKDYPQPIVDHAAASKANMVCVWLQAPQDTLVPTYIVSCATLFHGSMLRIAHTTYVHVLERFFIGLLNQKLLQV